MDADRGEEGIVLSAIVAVTFVVPDLEAVERAYQRTLGYQEVERAQLAPDAAEAWGATPLAGHPYAILRPSSGEPVYIRVIQGKAEPRPAFRTLGWNATEILVEDPAELARRMERSAFKVVGPPAPLDVNPAVVAMQALGPAGEALYFTRIPPGKSKFNLGSATSFVDRVFIVVLGVHDIRRTLDFYASEFGMQVTDPAPSRIGVLADAWGLPSQQTFQIGIVRLPERFLIEVDEYPDAAKPPADGDGRLPSRMAMVSFTVPSLEPFSARLLTAPRVLGGVPWNGRRTATMRGPSGEIIELIEAPTDVATQGAQDAGGSSRQR
jgi:catechol 2,3-dioxygenase-like lactoylglutathione lyase family enzyme